MTAAVLIRLLLARGELVTVDELVRDIWIAPGPRAAATRPVTPADRSLVYGRIRDLRRIVQPDGAPEVVLTDRGGVVAYRLMVERAEVDLYQFEDALGQAVSADDDAAIALLTGALALWQGRPLLDVEAAPFARETIKHLQEGYAWAGQELVRRYVARGDLEAARVALAPLLSAAPADAELQALANQVRLPGPTARPRLPAMVRPTSRRGRLVAGLVVAFAVGLVIATTVVGRHLRADQLSAGSPTDTLSAALKMLKGQSYNVTLSKQNGRATGHGSFDGPNHSGMLEEVTRVQGQSINFAAIEVGSQIWVKVSLGVPGAQAGPDPSKWMLVEQAKVTGSMGKSFYLNRADALNLAALLSDVSGVTRVDATHLAGTVDLTAATGVSRPDFDILTSAGDAAKSMPFTVELDSQARLIDLKITGTGPASDLTEEIKIFSYGTPARIIAPAAADVIDAPPAVYEILNR